MEKTWKLLQWAPWDPNIQIIPTLGTKSVNITYIGLFGSSAGSIGTTML